MRQYLVGKRLWYHSATPESFARPRLTDTNLDPRTSILLGQTLGIFISMFELALTILNMYRIQRNSKGVEAKEKGGGSGSKG
jgi:hypothetical protein